MLLVLLLLLLPLLLLLRLLLQLLVSGLVPLAVGECGGELDTLRLGVTGREHLEAAATLGSRGPRKLVLRELANSAVGQDLLLAHHLMSM